MAPPAVRIAVENVLSKSGGAWRITWLIANDSPDALVLDDAWIPHGRFRGEGHIALRLAVPPGQTTHLELTVFANEPPDTVVENAYLILRSRGWRWFARMTVTFDAASAPQPRVEAVTLQSIQ